MIALYIFIVLSIVGFILFFMEIKKAPIIDEKEPFLKGDYCPNNIVKMEVTPSSISCPKGEEKIEVSISK